MPLRNGWGQQDYGQQYLGGNRDVFVMIFFGTKVSKGCGLLMGEPSEKYVCRVDQQLDDMVLEVIQHIFFAMDCRPCLLAEVCFFWELPICTWKL